MYCVLIDYEKAFDKINRSFLWQKLLVANVSSKFVCALRSMYTVVKSCVRYRSSASSFFNSYNGLKQGDPRSPLLFMLFINDNIQNINVGLAILADIESYCNIRGLKINTAKTKAMIFEKGRHTHFNFYLNNVRLEVVTSFKYLCIHFFKNGNRNRTQKRLSQHAAFALHNLFPLFRQIELTTSQKCKLFDFMVGSVLNYSAEVWGNNEAKDIEILHTKFCRWILQVRKSTNLSGLYGELSRFPLIVYRKISMIRYWIKILSSSNTFIPKIIYSMLKTDLDNNIIYNGSNWAFQIKNILDDLGFSNIWIYQNDIDIPFNLIKQRLLDTYKQSWYSTINNSYRLETYARCKHEFEIEKYLDFIKEKKFKFALTQFRLSSHNLAIERGRFENIT